MKTKTNRKSARADVNAYAVPKYLVRPPYCERKHKDARFSPRSIHARIKHILEKFDHQLPLACEALRSFRDSGKFTFPRVRHVYVWVPFDNSPASKSGDITPEAKSVALLSVLWAKRNGVPTKLITNERGSQVLKDVPFDRVQIEEFDNSYDGFWASPKLAHIKSIVWPDIYLDLDVVIRDPLLYVVMQHMLTFKNVLFQNLESPGVHCMWEYYDVLVEAIKGSCCPQLATVLSRAPRAWNCGLIAHRYSATFDFWASSYSLWKGKLSKDRYFHSSRRSIAPDLAVEQHRAGALLDFSEAEGVFGISNRAMVLASDIGYSHYFGSYKHSCHRDVIIELEREFGVS